MYKKYSGVRRSDQKSIGSDGKRR